MEILSSYKHFPKKKLVEGVTKYKTSQNIFGKENNMHLLAQAKKNLSRHSDIFPFHCVFLKPKLDSISYW